MDRLGFGIFATGIVLGWIGIHFNSRVRDDVKRLAPSRAIRLRNLFDTISNARTWTEHRRLFPKSRVRNQPKAFFMAALFVVLVGFVLLGVKI